MSRIKKLKDRRDRLVKGLKWHEREIKAHDHLKQMIAEQLDTTVDDQARLNRAAELVGGFYSSDVNDLNPYDLIELLYYVRRR